MARLRALMALSGIATRERRDKLIAAHALALDVVLVTNNPKDFAAYPGLKIENRLNA